MPDEPIDLSAVDLWLDPSTGDLGLSEGEAVAVQGLDAIAQLCRLALNLWRAEWFWSPSEGMPMVETVLARGTPPEDIKSVFRRALLAVPGVTGLTSLTITRDSIARTLDVAFVADTDAGTLNSSDYQPFIVTP